MKFKSSDYFRSNLARAALLALATLLIAETTRAQSAAFTYQGRLTEAGSPASNMYDMQFRLFDAPGVGTGEQYGSTLTKVNVDVSNGGFAVELDFGEGVFDGSARFLEISIRPAGSTAAYTLLSPRQPITSVPYALRSVTADSAETAANATLLGGLTSSGFVQNSAAQQPATNFNIGGTGTANIINATTQFNLGGSRILSNAGTDNLFAGIGAGTNNTTGTQNSFFGINAGQTNTTGGGHTFFGFGAGRFNTAVCCNSFFGRNAGRSNTSGITNSFFGDSAGENNTTGMSNSFFGHNVGQNNTTGNSNSFFGEASGILTTTGGSNSFFGTAAGFRNSTGAGNSFFGASAGTTNTTGTNNTIIGAAANVGANNLNFATAIGAQSVVSASNTIVLGRILDMVQIPGSLNISGQAGAPVFDAITQFNIGGSRILSNAGMGNLFVGVNAGQTITTGSNNTFLGNSAGMHNTTGSSNIFIGAGAGNQNPSTQVSNSVAIGAGASVSASNTIVLGTIGQTTGIPGSFIARANQSEVFAPALEVSPSQLGGSVIANNLYIRQFNELGSPAHVCWRASNAGVPALVLTTCTSSLSSARDKTEMEPFSGGLNIIERLNPMSFKWKEDAKSDIGLNAEDVAEVEPLLVTRNARGEVEDVKHANMLAVFINAFKQQQQQIERQQAQIDLLKRIVCLHHPDADLCKPAK
jgi:hypothetical protein